MGLGIRDYVQGQGRESRVWLYGDVSRKGLSQHMEVTRVSSGSLRKIYKV